MQVRLRQIRPGDAPQWEKLRCELWPDGVTDHGPEIASFFAGTLKELAAVLVAESTSQGILGFAELSVRTDLTGLEGQRVGYVEGLYVRPEVRGRGMARKLLQASRTWAKQQECAAFASDRAGRIIIDGSFSQTGK